MAAIRLIATAGLFAAAISAAAADEGRGTKDEAKALLDKAVAHVNAVGTDKAFADFTNKEGGFVDRDLYVYCFDMEGKAVAHGGNPGLIGKNLMGMKDPDGIEPVKESIHIVQASGAGTLDFKWPNPISKKIEAKSAFLSKAI
jgi:signal transduction histidine kinase